MSDHKHKIDSLSGYVFARALPDDETDVLDNRDVVGFKCRGCDMNGYYKLSLRLEASDLEWM